MKRAQLIEFAKSTGLKVIFGLNALVGRKQNEPYWNYTGAWDSSNAEDLLNEFSTSYPESIFAYELGNEVNLDLTVREVREILRLPVNMVLQHTSLPINTLPTLSSYSKSATELIKIQKRFRISSELTIHLIFHG